MRETHVNTDNVWHTSCSSPYMSDASGVRVAETVLEFQTRFTSRPKGVIPNGCQEEGCEEEGHEEEGCEEEEVTGILDLARPEGRAGSRRPPLVFLLVAVATPSRATAMLIPKSGRGTLRTDEPSSPIRAVRSTTDGWTARASLRRAASRAARRGPACSAPRRFDLCPAAAMRRTAAC